MDGTTIFIIVILIIGIYIAYKIGRKIEEMHLKHEFESKIPEIRKDAIKRSRAVIGGQFSEQLAPYLPNFPFKPTECKFIGNPIDLLVFEGLDDKEISTVHFVEIKSGNSKLNATEKKLKDAILNKRVDWLQYDIPEELTKKK